MPRKKSKLNLKRLKKDKRFLRARLPLLILFGMAIGLTIAWLQPPDVTPKNLVWKANDSVNAPADLVKFLRAQDDCKNYQGTNTPRGVGLWGIYQTSKGKFAKVSYGCSTNLSTYIMAVKDNGKWQLLPPTEYFASQSTAARFLPKCSFIDKYKIDSSIEPFCIEADGTPRENKLQ